MFDILFKKELYENKPVFVTENGVINYDVLRILVKEKASAFLAQDDKNCVICDDNHFEFIMNFLAAISAGKKIFLGSDDCCERYFKSELSLFSKTDISSKEKNLKDFVINFCTSGSSGNPKIIKKSLFNLIREAEDLNEMFFAEEKELIFSTTTLYHHLFGMTFGLMVPIIGGFTINLKNKNYPENVTEKDSCLVTSPSFLAKMKKYNSSFAQTPKFLVAAGAKLEDAVFKYFEKNSKIIEIYGSTETGVVAYRTSSRYKYLTRFPNVKIEQVEEKNYKIFSDYFFEDEVEIADEILFNEPDKMLILGRTDRILKINEKRISPSLVEKQIQHSGLTEDVYCLKIEEKLAAAVVLNAKGIEYFKTKGQIELIKLLKSTVVSSSVKPKKWRFLPEIYKTYSGKIDKDKIEKIFLTNATFPLVLSQSLSENYAEYEMFFPEISNFFRGHFTGFKILPGVAELYFVLFFANDAFKIPMEVQVLKKIKFSHIIFPEKTVKLKIVNEPKSVEFAFESDGIVCASGNIIKTNVFKIG